MMAPRKAWKLLEDHLEPDAGYEGDEIVECADYIAKYDEAWDVIERLVAEYGDIFSGGHHGFS